MLLTPCRPRCVGKGLTTLRKAPSSIWPHRFTSAISPLAIHRQLSELFLRRSLARFLWPCTCAPQRLRKYFRPQQPHRMTKACTCCILTNKPSRTRSPFSSKRAASIHAPLCHRLPWQKRKSSNMELPGTAIAFMRPNEPHKKQKDSRQIQQQYPYNEDSQPEIASVNLETSNNIVRFK